MGCLPSSKVKIAPAQPPAYPAPTETELAIQKEILESLQKEYVPTEEELKMQDYTLKILEQQIADLPVEQQYRKESLEALQQQISYTEDQLTQLAEARNLGEITGDLTQEEIDTLNRLEQNSISSLTEVVGEDAQEMVKTEIASLVQRGVLQGNIGEEAIAKIGEKATKTIAAGTRDIESTRMQQELGMKEATKQRNLELQKLVQSGMLNREQALMAMAQSGYESSKQLETAQQQMAMQAQLSQNQLLQQRENAMRMAGISQWGQMAGARGAQAQTALGYAGQAQQAAIAQSQLNFQKQQSKDAKIYGFMSGQGMSGYSGY